MVVSYLPERGPGPSLAASESEARRPFDSHTPQYAGLGSAENFFLSAHLPAQLLTSPSIVNLVLIPLHHPRYDIPFHGIQLGKGVVSTSRQSSDSSSGEDTVPDRARHQGRRRKQNLRFEFARPRDLRRSPGRAAGSKFLAPEQSEERRQIMHKKNHAGSSTTMGSTSTGSSGPSSGQQGSSRGDHAGGRGDHAAGGGLRSSSSGATPSSPAAARSPPRQQTGANRSAAHPHDETAPWLSAETPSPGAPESLNPAANAPLGASPRMQASSKVDHDDIRSLAEELSMTTMSVMTSTQNAENPVEDRFALLPEEAEDH